MKTVFILSTVFIVFFSRLSAQDTIFRKNKTTIISKVIEITPTEIKYKAWDNPDGPNYVVYSSDIFKIKFQNGTESVITPDVYALNQESQILNKTQSVKFSVFSPLNYNICLGYEKMLKVGINLEAKIAYIGAGYKVIYNKDVTGSYMKIGTKFLLGQDFYMNGLRYIHPLKGRFIKLEVTYAFYKMKNVEFNKQIKYTNNSYYSYSSIPDKTDISTNSGALNIIYGRQFILGNIITLDYFAGLGYGLASSHASNPDYKASTNNSYGNNSTFGFLYYTSKFPVTFTAGLNIGVIF